MFGWERETRRKKLKNVSLECQKGKERYLSYIENCLFILILINKVGGVARNKQFSKIQSYLLWTYDDDDDDTSVHLFLSRKRKPWSFIKILTPMSSKPLTLCLEGKEIGKIEIKKKKIEEKRNKKEIE